jgi:hypothetical protein
VRRTVATLLVVATALLMAVPVGASEAPPARPAVLPAAPAVAEPAAVPAAPAVVQAPAAPAVTAVQAPAAPAATPAVARPAVKSLRPKPLTRAGLSDAAYAARLQADLCLARQIFCGLDHSGRYPAR